MRVMKALVVAVGMVCWTMAAQDATTNAAGALPLPAAPGANALRRGAMTMEDHANYVRITREEVQLNARLKLLTELADEHLARAEALTKASDAEKAQWEKDLAQEFRTKGMALVGQLNAVTSQRTAFEAAHAPASLPALSIFGETKALTADEFAYLSRLDEMMLRARQELVAIDEAAAALRAELQTNNTAEAVGKLSDLLEENAKQASQWAKEQSDLELKQLEFRAMRK